MTPLPTTTTSIATATTPPPATRPTATRPIPEQMDALPGPSTSAPPQPATAPHHDAEADMLHATPTISAAVIYLWPTQLPRGLVVDAEHSSATADGFVLTLVDPTGGQWHATVQGGDDYAVREPLYGTEPIPIRGQDGAMFTTGGGYSLFWHEAGCPCQVGGGLTLEDTLLLTESLEVVDLATWQQRLDDHRRQT